jgi:RND family efflux transporter MFP subunit
MQRRRLRYILPPVVILLGVLTLVVMVKSRRPASRQGVDVPPPLVRVGEVETQEYRYRVHSQGTVTPRTATTLTAEVGGRIQEVSPTFDSGGFFEKGEVLVVLESLDYEAAVERARVALAQAERRLAEENALADVARREWERSGEGEANPLTLREPQLAEAEAAVGSAQKALEQAERDLDRTRVRAPYEGRIRSAYVDVGQFLGRGAPIADIYSVDVAEVRLPISPADLAYVQLPLRSPERMNNPGPEVILTADVAGRRETWTGTIDRTEGEIDPKTRLVYAVARVPDPYRPEANHLPLAVGLFVEADITGRTAEDVIVLPRSAVRGRNEVLVVDSENRLRRRTVEVLRTEDQAVVIGAGLEPGERVCLSPLDTVVDGMPVRVAGAAPDTTGGSS